VAVAVRFLALVVLRDQVVAALAAAERRAILREVRTLAAAVEAAVTAAGNLAALEL
jgi:hypothetical protein